MTVLDLEIIKELTSRCEDVRPIPRCPMRHFGLIISQLAETDPRKSYIIIGHVESAIIAGIELLASVHRRKEDDGLAKVISDLKKFCSSNDISPDKNLTSDKPYKSAIDAIYRRTRPTIEKVRRAQNAEGTVQYRFIICALADAVGVLSHYRNNNDRFDLSQPQSEELYIGVSPAKARHMERRFGEKDPNQIELWYEAMPRAQPGGPATSPAP